MPVEDIKCFQAILINFTSCTPILTLIYPEVEYDNLRGSWNTRLNPIAIPMKMEKTSEQVVFCPSRVWRPCATGFRSKLI
jgi:hypothetical protein